MFTQAAKGTAILQEKTQKVPEPIVVQSPKKVPVPVGLQKVADPVVVQSPKKVPDPAVGPVVPVVAAPAVGFGKDLSEEAMLLYFYAPEYTEEALEAELSGLYAVSVLVSKKGRALKAKLEEPIGYGMDEEVLRASSEALFSPPKNKIGKVVEAWTEIHIQLEML